MPPLDYRIETSIHVTTEFIQFHRWPTASWHFPKRAYLQDLHRHKFFVTLEIAVGHLDRELEYHEVLDSLNAMIVEWTGNSWDPTAPCELMAKHILSWSQTQWPDRPWYGVTVDEDAENGSTVQATVLGPAS